MLNKQEQILELLKERVVSEKSEKLESLNVVVFKVRKSATKHEVVQAVELFFETKVKKINLLKVKGKVKSVKGRLCKKADWKKAYVTLFTDQQKNISDIEEMKAVDSEAGEV